MEGRLKSEKHKLKKNSNADLIETFIVHKIFIVVISHDFLEFKSK